MNATQIKQELKNLAGAPLEDLDKQQLAKLEKLIAETTVHLDRAQVVSDLTRYMDRLPAKIQRRLKKEIKERGLKKPAKSAPPALVRSYLAAVQKIVRTIESEITEKTSFLEKLRQQSPEQALGTIAKLSEAERKEYSELAALSTLAGGRTKKLKLSASEKNNRQWLAVLQRGLAGDNLAVRK